MPATLNTRQPASQREFIPPRPHSLDAALDLCRSQPAGNATAGCMMLNPDVVREIEQWAAAGHDAEAFPLDAVIAEFRRVGKHFVDVQLLEALARVRAGLPAGSDRLRRFLDTALDKYDGRFDNPSYLALHDIPMPTTAGGCPLHTTGAERQRDRLIALLVADVLRFELAALDGATDLLPLLRPDARVVGKRCALGLRLLRTALPRIGIDAETGTADA